MAYQSKARRIVKDTREPVPGNGNALPTGKIHKVTIHSMKYYDNQVQIDFRDGFDNGHKENVFLLNVSGNDLSNTIKQLITAIAKDSTELRELYESFMSGGSMQLTGSGCTIETEYRGDFINIKTIRSSDDNRNDGRGFFQSAPTDQAHTKTPPTSGQSKQTIRLPLTASTFF